MNDCAIRSNFTINAGRVRNLRFVKKTN